MREAHDEKIQTVISDFRRRQSAKSMENSEFIRRISEDYEYCFDEQEKKNKEIRWIKKLYDSEEAIDFFGQAVNQDEREMRKLFRSNFMAKATNIRAALMTDSRPKVVLKPIFREGALAEFTSRMQEWPEWVQQMVEFVGNDPELFFDLLADASLEQWWNKYKVPNTFYLMIKNAILSRKSCAWVRLNERGDIGISYIDGEQVADDPDALIEEDRRFIFHTMIKDTREIERIFGLKKGEIEAEPKYSDVVGGQLGAFEDKAKAQGDKRLRRPRARLVVGYYKDEKTVEVESDSVPMTDDNGEYLYDEKGNLRVNPPEIGEYKLYPNGRIIIFVCGQNDKIRILADEPNELSGLPIPVFIPEPDTELDGRPIGRDLIPAQMLADKAVQQAVMNFEVVGNAKVFYVKNGITDAKYIDNQVGKKIPVSSTSDIKYEPGIPVVAEGMSLFAAFKNIAADESGIHEAAEGRRPAGVESGRAIISLIESVNKRMRPSIRFFEAFLEKVFTIWGELYLRIANEGFKISLGKGFKTVVALPFKMSDYIDSFEIEVIEDSAVPKDAVTRANTALTLASLVFEDGKPGMDRLSIYELLGIENGEQIKMRIDNAIEREQQVQQMAQMIEQQQQQLAQAEQVINELAGENESVKQAANETFVKAEVDLQKTQANAQTSILREQMRQEGKKEAIVLQGGVNKALATMQSKRG